MTGQLIYLVGPSGSGKDSILRGLAQTLPEQYHIMQRVITRRPCSLTESSESISEVEFIQQQQQGAFALAWQANGLRYGVRTELDHLLAAGKQVIVNGSRGHWQYALARYPSAILVLVQVQEHLLRQRLIERGRESLQEIQLRLERNASFEQRLEHETALQNTILLKIDNSGDLSYAIDQLTQQLQRQHMGAE